MSKSKARRILAVLAGIVLVVGGYIGWQMYQGQQLADQYAADAQKLAQGAGNGSGSVNSQTQGSNELTPVVSPAQNTPSGASTSQAPQPNSSAPSSPSGTSSSGEYKQLMSSPYQQTLQAMQNVKSSTLALQAKKLSPSAYKASIVQAQATFSSAEAYVRANPPTEENLNPSYQEFLAGISLAKQSMGVVLNGVSSLSPSNFYAAREMGKTAQQQVVNGYSNL
jgi:predicted negative regulator of RcsB-dependent stress response